jgi:predicted Zn-dependent protease with MMP-like domain
MPEQDNDADILQDIQDGELEDFLTWRARVRGANISEKTLLATDYLNHFNEIVMLIEMVPDMPDMIEDCRLWRPKSYQQHFRDSGFSEKELAIEAYDHVPNKFRTPFEATIAQMDAVILFTLGRMEAAHGAGDDQRLKFDCATSVEMLHKIMQVANGIIHGTTHVMQQGEIDDYMGV